MSENKPKSPGDKQVQLKIKLDEEVAQGQYCNLVMLNHSETEFVLDFIYVQPQQPHAKVRSRIQLHPKQAKLLGMALAQNLAKFEEKFGPVGAVKRVSPTSTEIH